jgi:hypothetical protein
MLPGDFICLLEIGRIEPLNKFFLFLKDAYNLLVSCSLFRSSILTVSERRINLLVSGSLFRSSILSVSIRRDCMRLLETGRIELLSKLHGTRRFYASFRNRKN